MEALALSHSFVSYESPESELQLKSLDELGLKIPNSAWLGVAGMAVALSVLSVAGEAQASCGYSRCGKKSHHSHHSYAAVSHQRRPAEYPQPTQQLFSCNRQVISWRLRQIDRSLQKRLGSTQRWRLGVCLVALLTLN
jgi:hypothetical protein